MVAALTSAVVGLDGRVAIGASGAVSARLQVATDLAFSGVTYSPSVPVVNGYAKAQITGLAAGTWYYYRVGLTDSGGTETFTSASNSYRLRTAPTGQTSFSFSFSSCCDASDSGAMTAIAARNDDFFCHLGDLYYNNSTTSTALSSYRAEMLKKIKAPHHASVFTSRPVIYTPSDHDFAMANGGTGATSGAAKTNFNQIYRELWPTPSLPGGNLGVYHTFAWGRVRFIVLDTRTFKSAPSDPDNESKTALGSTQKAWVKSTIIQASEPLIVFVQESPWIGSASGPGEVDGWKGYTTERAEIGAFCVASGKKFAMIAGDMHAVGADSGVNSVGGFPVFQGAPLHNATSFKGGPYSSGTYPTQANAGPVIEAYGRLVVTDAGSTISLAFTGYTADNTARITQTSTFAITGGGGGGGGTTVQVPLKILYGNMQGGFGLTEKKWNTRIPAEVALVANSGADLFFPTELHADPDKPESGLPDGGAVYFLNQLKQTDSDWACVPTFKGGNGCFYRPSVYSVLGTKPVYFDAKTKTDSASRNLNDFTIRHNASNLVVHVVNTHLEYRSGTSPDAIRQSSIRQTIKYLAGLGNCVFVGDLNSSTERKNQPRDLMRKAGWLALRERGTVTNGTQSTFSTASNKHYWLDEIYTRPAQTVTNAALVKTNGASDHNGWLRADVIFDAAAAPPPPPPSPAPFVMPKPYTGRPWMATLRGQDFAALDPLRFISATLVETYNQPDMLSMTGTWRDLDAAMQPGQGVLLYDDRNRLRFNGHLVDIDRQGTKRATLIFASDLVRLWWKSSWPNPLADWTTPGQTAVNDVVSGPAETRLLSYVSRNMPRDPYTWPLLRLPISQGRGDNSTSTVRFGTIGDLASTLAEQANLRMRMVQSYESSAPHLDLLLEDTHDMSDVVSFSPPGDGGMFLLDPSWRYRIALPTVNVALGAAGGTGAGRILTILEDQDSQDLWFAHIEQIVDLGDTTDATEIATGLSDAIAAGAGPTEISLPIGRAPGLGREIPTGTVVAAATDGQVFYDRIRQITTELTKQTSQPTVKVTGTIGSPDGGIKTPTQRRLSQALANAKRGQAR